MRGQIMIKLLVVDDEAGICESIKQIFTYVGFSVFTATTAKKALKIIDRDKPKIIFLDILMPDVDGIDLLKQIKSIDPKAIVIMVTARQDEEAKEKSLKAGADEFITKPFSHNYLRDVVLQKIKDVLDKGGHMQKPSILIVDDEKEARDNLKNYIEPRFVCDIEEAADALTSIEKTKSLKPDIVLLDIKMPGMSGIDAIGEIKKESPDSKIIVISAWKSSEAVSQAIRAGASDYIGKPISLSAFGEKLRSVLISRGKLILKKP